MNESDPDRADRFARHAEDEWQAYADRREMGVRFRSRSVADRYRCRPPYSEEVFGLLRELRRDRTPVVLDAGCGTGKLARALAPEVERVDAIDPSEDMLEVGRSLENGDHPAIHWVCSTIEEAPLQPPYGLAVAGASFHWFAADRILARLREVMEAGAVLVLLSGDAAWRPPWEDAEQEVLTEFLTSLNGAPPTWRSEDLEQQRLLDHPNFDLQGERVTAPVRFEQSVEDYLACQHSRASFTLETMGSALARDFDTALAEALAPHTRKGRLSYDQRTRMEWGFAR